MTGYDLAIVGAGPGGYVAAIRAAQLGKKVAVVERAELGGICANWGCIPTKALLHSAEVFEMLHRLDELGLAADALRFDFRKVILRSRAIAERQAKGVAYLLKKNKIDHVAGTARFVAPRTLQVDGKELPARDVIIATGARPRPLPLPAPGGGRIEVGHDGDRLLSYREAMALATQPESLIIVGAGAIGVEFAYFYSVLGTRVTLVEALPQILPVEDEEIARALARSLSRRGIEILTGATVDQLEKSDRGVTVTVRPAGAASPKVLSAERALIAVGVRANVEGLGLEEIGVKLERGFIAVDRASYVTSVPGVYAIGDVIGPPMLAHKASAEGVACVEGLAGHARPPIDYSAIPGCTYCKPEVASVGMTERAARAAGREIKIGRFPWQASGKAMAVGETEGFVKVILDAKHGELLGAHMLGGTATDLIAAAGLARSAELTADEIIAAVHPHPTFAEALKEAVEDAFGRAIDI